MSKESCGYGGKVDDDGEILIGGCNEGRCWHKQHMGYKICPRCCAPKVTKVTRKPKVSKDTKVPAKLENNGEK